MESERPKPNSLGGDLSRRSFLGGTIAGIFAGMSGVGSASSGFGAQVDLAAVSWPSFRYDRANTGGGANISIPEETKITWSRSINDPRDTGSAFSPSISAPVRSHRFLIYTTTQAVVARGSGDGALIWRNEEPQSCAVRTIPTIAKDLVITANKQVSAWEITTGEKRWTTDLSPSSASSPLTAGSDLIYVGTSQGLGGSVHAIDSQTGKQEWSVSMDNGVSSEVAIGDDAVYAVDDGGLIKRIEDSETAWEVDMGGIEFRTLAGHKFFAPILLEGSVAVPQIYTPEGEDGERFGGIFIFDREDGSLISSETYLQNIDVSATFLDGKYAIANTEGQITGGSVSNSYEDWSKTNDEKITTALNVINELIFFGTEAGNVIAIDPASGERQESYEVLSEPINAVIAGDSAIFVTGKFNSIGGIHIETSVDARVKLQELLDLFSTAKSYGKISDSSSAKLTEAARYVASENYDAAVKAAKSGKETLDGEISQIKTIQERIISTRQRAIELKNQTPADTSGILNNLDEAVRALQQQDTRLANELTEQSESRVEHIESSHKNATIEREQLTDSISKARTQSIPIYNATEKLNESKSAFKNGDFETATSVASASRRRLETRMKTIETYRDRKERAKELINTIDDEGGIVPEQREQYEKATKSFDAQEFETAVRQMSETVEKLENKNSYIESYQENQAEFEEHKHEADSNEITLSEAQNINKEARKNFEIGEYSNAADQMINAVRIASNTIATAHEARETIAAAESFDPIQPFVSAVATQLGSVEYLSVAKKAIQSGDYDRALAKASQARSAQQSARAIINGGIGASTVGIYGVYRYDGLEKLAQYLIDTK